MNQYLQVFLKGIQKQSSSRGKSFVVAFTAYSPGEGVSYVAQSFGLELSRRTGKRTLIAGRKSKNLHSFRKTQSLFRLINLFRFLRLSIARQIWNPSGEKLCPANRPNLPDKREISTDSNQPIQTK